jgi:hypothetical protein
MQIVPYPLNRINFPKITLYLETYLAAIDMGWRIGPAQEAEFNLTQGLIPLRDILEGFSRSLARECSDRNLENPFADLNLYEVFRTLKEQSYTYSFVLRTPLGVRHGKILLSTLYGLPDSGEEPILLVQGNDEGVMENLRNAVKESQVAELDNPYDLETLFQRGEAD